MAIVNLYQLKKMSEALQTYDASKVKTNVEKPEKDAGTYSVDELFAKITEDVKGVNKLLADFKSKKICDIVRLELPVDHEKAELPFDLDEKVPGMDKTILLPAYTEDNNLLLDLTGQRLTVDMRTGALSGIPAMINAKASAQDEDGRLIYSAVAVTKIKVFPVGQWTLETLPTNALLDNEEMQLLANRSAIDKLVVELAQDEDLLSSVKKQIGTRAIEEALSEKVDVKDLYAMSPDNTKIALYRKTSDKIGRADLDEGLEKVASGEEQLQKDAKSLREDVTALQTSYDASKVRTKFRTASGSIFSVNDYFDKVTMNTLRMPQAIRTPSGASAWEQDHAYVADTVVLLDNERYICTRAHTASALTKPSGKNNDWWIQLEDDQTIFGYGSVYSQIEKRNIAATEEKPAKITIQMHGACTAPIEVLRLENKPVTKTETSFVDAAAEKDKVVLPKDLFTTSEYKTLVNISIMSDKADTAKIMVAVTNDGTKYQTYDFDKNEWAEIDVSADGKLLASGIEAAKLIDIKSTAWSKINTTGKLGIAYVLHKEKDEDECEITSASITGVLPDFWRHTESSYGYDTDSNLVIELKESGSYRINYQSGYQRGAF